MQFKKENVLKGLDYLYQEYKRAFDNPSYPAKGVASLYRLTQEHKEKYGITDEEEAVIKNKYFSLF